VLLAGPTLIKSSSLAAWRVTRGVVLAGHKRRRPILKNAVWCPKRFTCRTLDLVLAAAVPLDKATLAMLRILGFRWAQMPLPKSLTIITCAQIRQMGESI